MRTMFTLLAHGPGLRRNIVAGLAGVMLGSISGYGIILWSNRNAPVIVHDEREVDGGNTGNGYIDIYVELDRLRDCPAQTSRWLWTWDDREGQHLKHFFPLANNATTITDAGRDQRFILSIPIPPGVWPGHWFYRSKTIEHCSLLPGLFRAPVRESADIPIHIVDPPARPAPAGMPN